MTEYISAASLKSFYTQLAMLQSASDTYLEDNIITRTKLAIDRYCFTSFDTVDHSDQKFLEIQLAQKILAGSLFLREQESVKTARQAVGQTGGENRGDWTYNLTELDDLFTKEVVDILEKYRDWNQADALLKKPKTGKVLLEGDLFYDSEINSY